MRMSSPDPTHYSKIPTGHTEVDAQIHTMRFREGRQLIPSLKYTTRTGALEQGANPPPQTPEVVTVRDRCSRAE